MKFPCLLYNNNAYDFSEKVDEMSQQTMICESVNATGYGVVAGKDRKYLVSGLLPGEEAVIEIGESGIAALVRLVTASPLRVKPPCPRYADCGGCQLQHADYSFQLELKTRAVKEAFQNHGLNPELVLSCIGMKEPYHYRNKIQMVISEKGKKVMAGFYEENTHKIVNVDDCVIQDSIANGIIRTCKTLLAKHKIPPYDERRREGLLRHIMIKRSSKTGQILLILVTASEIFPGRNNFISELRRLHPEITSIVQNVNSRETSVVLGDFERVLFGPGTIEDELQGKRFLVSPRTFYQVNAEQMDLLYRKAIELAKPKSTDILVDAYCGVGTIGILFSDQVKEVYGVEINQTSIKNAIQNARLNHVRNVHFTAADAKDYLAGLAEDSFSIDILTIDPPRNGLDLGLFDVLKKIKPTKVVYISCDPNTLARDLEKMVSIGYKLKQAQPIDMFCQTFHVETVTLLSLK